MHLLSIIGISAIPVAVLLMLVYLIALRLRRNDLVDVIWGLGFIVIAWTSAIAGGNIGKSSAVVIVTLLVTLWGLRLAGHIGRRWLRSKQEDRRYLEMRERWGEHQAWHSLFNVFLPQGALMLIVSLPVIVINVYSYSGSGTFVWFGTAVWVFGFVFEVIGDHQLSEFLGNPANRGKIMTRGLWSYTRHPNYFGEVTQWWGIAVIALSVPYGWIGLIGAATITFLITEVSGIPLAEAGFVGRPGWDAYKKQTPPLIPRLSSPSKNHPK